MRYDFARSSAQSCQIESIANLTFWLSMIFREKTVSTADQRRGAFLDHALAQKVPAKVVPNAFRRGDRRGAQRLQAPDQRKR